MALTGHPFPYDIETLLGGAVRILYAETTQVVPTNIDDVFEMNGGGYVAKSGWTELGATKEGFSYSRNFDTEGQEIQQVAGNVLEEITDISRSIELSVAAFDARGFQLMENAPNVTSIAAGVGKSAQKKIAFGSFQSLKRYRWAFVSRRSNRSGVVTESGGATRGRFVMGTAYEAQLAADEIEMEQSKGELTAASLTWTMFPTDGQPSGEEWGAWYLEEPGAIAAA